MSCCSSKCSESIPDAYILRAKDTREKLGVFAWDNHIITLLRGTGSRLYLQGNQICSTSYAQAHCISRPTFFRLRQIAKTSALIRIHGNSTALRTCNGKSAIVGSAIKKDESRLFQEWFRSHVDLIADKHPETGHQLLPPCYTKSEFYSMFCTKYKISTKDFALPTFYKIWTTSFRNVTIPAQSRFSKCDACCAIKLLMESSCLLASERAALADHKTTHLELIRQHRQQYMQHRLAAMDQPSEFASLIIDGMDQNKTDLPHLYPEPKIAQSCTMLRTHLTGVIDNGAQIAYTFVDVNEYPHDSNLTVSLLVAALLKLKSWPRVLYLQLDNTSRENKNRIVFAWLAAMVHVNLFDEIHVNFHPVGHTHENVDQFFSCISRALRTTSARTLDQLMSIVTSSYKKAAPPERVKDVWNFAGSVPNISPGVHSLHGKHAFKICRVENRTLLYTKQFCSDVEWRPPIEILCSSLPSTNSQFVRKFPLEKMMPRLEDAFLADVRRSISKLGQQLPASDTRWWEEFLETGIIEMERADSAHPFLRLARHKQRSGTRLNPTGAPQSRRAVRHNTTSDVEIRADIAEKLEGIAQLVSPPPLNGETDVYAGALRRPDTEAGLRQQLMPGVFVVVVCEDPESPLCAEVIELDWESKSVNVAWLTCADGKYVPDYTTIRGRRKRVRFTQVLLISNIELCFRNFLLNGQLPKYVIDKWKYFQNLRNI